MDDVVFSNPKRKLWEEMSDENSKSNKCKVNCIDEGLIFCPNSVWSGGKCCTLEE